MRTGDSRCSTHILVCQAFFFHLLDNRHCPELDVTTPVPLEFSSLGILVQRVKFFLHISYVIACSPASPCCFHVLSFIRKEAFSELLPIIPAYVYARMCVYTCVCLCMCVCMQVCVCVYVYMYVRVHVCVCVCVQVYVWVYMCLCVCEHEYVCMCPCECTCTCSSKYVEAIGQCQTLSSISFYLMF